MTTTRTRLSDVGQLYVGMVAVVGIAVILHSLYALSRDGIGYQWFVLAGLTLLSGSFTIRIPTIPARLSVSETFVFAGAILFGPAAATVIVVLDSLIISLWLRKSSRHLLRVLFNMAAPAIAIWTATHAFFRIAGITPLEYEPRPILSLVAPLLLLALLYFLLNSWLIAGAVGFEKQLSPFRIWRDNFMWLSLNYFSGASVAALLLPYLQDDQRAFVRVAGILLPLLLISYLTFKTALGRVEDANRHLSELNRLYLSTIETLAMAIDAKDQITHGHIRRVQQYAVGLAHKVGISDPAQIQAIEAASLLHDMGKLAIPEYILNKPGKLTPAEFEKMKSHAGAGADILSAIEFPYPVVPIVRHHHENWDGTGYPDGLKGSDIPIGARILSVVDCFDALTSDRPYRPRLSDTVAINILLERRGSMYDPLIVDTFIRVHGELAPRAQSEDIQHGIPPIAREPRSPEPSPPGSGFDVITASTEEMLMLFDLARSLSGSIAFEDAAEAVMRHLRRTMPVSTCAFFAHDLVADDLVAVYTAGEHAAQFRDLRIPRGQRLTGWVAANRRTIGNSDPVLDLGEVARSLRPRLYSCLSTPISNDEQLIGVMSLYSAQREAFTEDHLRIAEVVAKQVAFSLGTLLAPQKNAPASLLPSFNENGVLGHHNTEPHFSVAFIQVGRPTNRAGEPVDSTLAQVARVLRQTLRGSDVIFRYSNIELVILLSHTGTDTAHQVRDRIAQHVARTARSSRDRETTLSPLLIGVATAPSDGSELDTLISAARTRAQSIEDFSSGPTSIH